jgi:transposase-like protein
VENALLGSHDEERAMRQVKQRRLGADKWRELLAKFADSGLSVRAFCNQEGINTSSFNWWRSRFNGSSRRLPSAKPMSAPAAGAFVDLGTLSTPPVAGERLELRLELGGGVLLHLVRG